MHTTFSPGIDVLDINLSGYEPKGHQPQAIGTYQFYYAGLSSTKIVNSELSGIIYVILNSE